jgi:hypothetical protein
MIALALTLASLALLLSVATIWWLARNRVRLERLRRVRIDREVHRNSRALHDLTSRAFASMLEVARRPNPFND